MMTNLNVEKSISTRNPLLVNRSILAKTLILMGQTRYQKRLETLLSKEITLVSTRTLKMMDSTLMTMKKEWTTMSQGMETNRWKTFTSYLSKN
jgi:hypothetical protein